MEFVSILPGSCFWYFEFYRVLPSFCSTLFGGVSTAGTGGDGAAVAGPPGTTAGRRPRRLRPRRRLDEGPHAPAARRGRFLHHYFLQFPTPPVVVVVAVVV